MQEAVRRPPCSDAVLLSADPARLIAASMRVDALMQAATLCRAANALFDSDAVWQDRLRQAEQMQYVNADVPVPVEAVLSAVSSLLYLRCRLSLRRLHCACERTPTVSSADAVPTLN